MQRIGADHGVEPGAVAVAWLLRHPAKILPILGTNDLQRMRSLAAASEVVLDRQTWFELYSLARGREVA